MSVTREAIDAQLLDAYKAALNYSSFIHPGPSLVPIRVAIVWLVGVAIVEAQP